MSEGTIWLISSGSYSDYGVAYTAATKELAEQIAAALNAGRRSTYDEYEVEERRHFTAMPEVWTRHAVQARWNPDFTLSGELTLSDFLANTELGGSKRPQITWFDERRRVLTVVGGDPEECKQDVYDRLAQMKAAAAGV